MEMDKNLIEWLTGHDTGRSSLSIVRRNFNLSGEYYHPLDADDFGRCYRLLENVPQIKLSTMVGASPIWNKMVYAWPILEIYYKENDFSRISQKIDEIEKEASEERVDKISWGNNGKTI